MGSCVTKAISCCLVRHAAALGSRRRNVIVAFLFFYVRWGYGLEKKKCNCVGFDLYPASVFDVLE